MNASYSSLAALADNEGHYPADVTFLQKGTCLHHVYDLVCCLLIVLQLVKGDIQSMDLLSFVLQAEQIDTIMHFAAQVGQHSTGQHSLCSGLQHGLGSHAVLSTPLASNCCA